MQGVERDGDASRQTIVLRSEKASDFEGELLGIADALTATLPDLTVEVADPLKSAPGTFLPPRRSTF